MQPHLLILPLLKKFSARLKELAGGHISKIILIGSYARDDYTGESDIDLVILLSSSSRQLRDRIYDCLIDFMLEHDVDISLKLINQASYVDWRKQGDPFIHSVETEGILI